MSADGREIEVSKVANVLFPADYFDRSEPDGALRVEYEAAVLEARLDVSLFDLELFDESGRVVLSHPFLDCDLPVIYRGWMMKPNVYEAFHSGLAELGLRPLVSPEEYAEFHMFPLAYERHEALRLFSPQLLAFQGTEVDADVVNERFSRFVVKDYVKSVKGTSFPTSIQTPITQVDLDTLVGEFVRLRGGLFTEGMVFKEAVNLKRYGDATNEWRAFYLQGRLLSVCRNSNQWAYAPMPPESLVTSCESLGSPYYTVDFAELEDGSLVVIETGDGQVSGLATAQAPVGHYRALADRLGKCG